MPTARKRRPPCATPCAIPTSSSSRSTRAPDRIARDALRNAKDHPSPTEVERVGTKSGFTREVATPEYEAKLAKLEDDVKKAEEELRRAGGRP